MASLDTSTRRALGRLLRELRTREGLTLAALSDRVGVSQSALSQFESGKAEPSLGTLWSLGRALNASLFDFFAGEPAPSVQVTRADERTVMDLGPARYEAVARSSNRGLDLFYLRLSPGDGAVREPTSHVGEECGTVLTGSLRVRVGDDEHVLGPGDGIWFDSAQPHTFAAVGEEECVSVWADTVPAHAPRPQQYTSVFADEPSTERPDQRPDQRPDPRPATQEIP